jgi:hypothetical protein
VTARHPWWPGLVALAPAFFVAVVYLEAFLASRALGHWPIPSLEDPKGLATAPLHLVSSALFLALVPAAAALLVFVGVKWREVFTGRVLLSVAIAVASWSLLLSVSDRDEVTWAWWAD